MAETVYVSNMNRSHDYSSATKFGALRPITTGNYPVFKTTRLMEEIIEALVHSTPEDHLLLSGASAIAGLCMSVWLEMHGKCKFLLWSRDDNQYVPRVIERTPLRVEIEAAKDRLIGHSRA